MNTYKKNFTLAMRLALLCFLEFAVWGAYLTSIGRYLGAIGLGSQIKWFFAMQGIVSLFMPTAMGILADRKIQAQKVLAICHGLAGAFMIAASMYCQNAGSNVEFGPLFTYYSISIAFFMPTIALINSVAYNAFTVDGQDPVSAFPMVRVWGTIGFIGCMLITNWFKIDGVTLQDSYTQMFFSGALSVVMCLYSFTMPKCPVNKSGKGVSFAESMGLKAFSLFKNRQFAVFFIFSMLLGASLQITNGYANMFLGSFSDSPDAFAVKNSNALLAISQLSETLCILLIPFCMRQFGIKKVMLISMFAWVLRFAFFGCGGPDMPGVLLFILSCIVYGVAFDFFNISGSLFVEKNASEDIRSSAQGLFMLMTNGLGAALGTLAAGEVMDAVVFNTDTPSWSTAWYIFAGYSLVVAIAFIFAFKDPGKKADAK